MEVGGSLVIDDSQEVSPAAGTIRWTGVDFEAYNGADWVSLTDGAHCPSDRS